MLKKYKISKEIGILTEDNKKIWTKINPTFNKQTIISSSADRTIRIWSLKSGECKILKDHTSSVSCLLLNLESKELISG